MTKLRVADIRVSIDEEPNLPQLAAKALKVPVRQIGGVEITRRALDARRKGNISFVYTLDVEIHETQLKRVLQGNSRAVLIKESSLAVLERGTGRLRYSPVVIGAGPAGLFAALKLAEYGYRPLLLERGKDVFSRHKDIKQFWETGILDPESNVQFGEGGAGTFSDGKLTTRINDPRVKEVFRTLIAAGAPEEIAYLHKPHVGTDKLRGIVKNLRNRIIDLGGRVFFQRKLSDILFDNFRLAGIKINQRWEIPADVMVLAIGHSARDTCELLLKRGFCLEPKPFAIGLRIEHPQEIIDRAQYGGFAGHPKLGAADYQLVFQHPEYERAAFSFCMCPGGQVVAAASEQGGVVTNGMSDYSRDSGVANSALVVSVGPPDFPGDSPLAGIEFQRLWEEKAFKLGGKNFSAPAQRVEDFLQDRPSSDVAQAGYPTYCPGVTPANLRDCLPKEVSEALSDGLRFFDKKIKDFAFPDACLTGVETRTSAPVRIVRGQDFLAEGFTGVYPAGEGAGYAGGIVSAAVDGLKVAEEIIKKFAVPIDSTLQIKVLEE